MILYFVTTALQQMHLLHPINVQSYSNSKRKKRRKKTRKAELENVESDFVDEKDSSRPKSVNESLPLSLLSGFGRGRTSALAIGPPPVLSGNIRAVFVTSIIHGDDIISRATKGSIDRLCDRVENVLKRNVLTKNVMWMADTVSLTVRLTFLYF